MLGQRFTRLALAALTVLVAGAAQAADYSQPYQPPPQPIIVQQPQEECCNNWYLRGQIGVGLNSESLDYTTQTSATLQSDSIADTVFIGGGVGYNVNNWLRVDATAEYRAKSRVYSFVTYGSSGIDEYQGNISSWVFLGNAYVDLGTWECFTPFVGVGVGGAYNTLADFTDVNPNGGYGFGRNPSEWHLAYAFYAGVSYDISKNFKVDLSYRYLNYGSITDTVDCSVTCTKDNFKFNLTSNDIMLGLRWTCCDFGPPPPPPRYVYRPPPPAYVPPISSRG